MSTLYDDKVTAWATLTGLPITTPLYDLEKAALEAIMAGTAFSGIPRVEVDNRPLASVVHRLRGGSGGDLVGLPCNESVEVALLTIPATSAGGAPGVVRKLQFMHDAVAVAYTAYAPETIIRIYRGSLAYPATFANLAHLTKTVECSLGELAMQCQSPHHPFHQAYEIGNLCFFRTDYVDTCVDWDIPYDDYGLLVTAQLTGVAKACSFTTGSALIHCTGHGFAALDKVQFATAVGGVAAKTAYTVSATNLGADDFQITTVFTSATGNNTVGLFANIYPQAYYATGIHPKPLGRQGVFHADNTSGTGVVGSITIPTTLTLLPTVTGKGQLAGVAWSLRQVAGNGGSDGMWEGAFTVTADGVEVISQNIDDFGQNGYYAQVPMATEGYGLLMNDGYETRQYRRFLVEHIPFDATVKIELKWLALAGTLNALDWTACAYYYTET
jgi:hypothetical protein